MKARNLSVFCLSALSLLIFSDHVYSNSSGSQISNCINAGINKVENTRRSESIEFSASAGKGRPLSCRTRRTDTKKHGNPPRSNEKIDGVSCRLISARWRPKERTKIFTCDVRNNRAFIHTQVSGKGCEHKNFATWEMKTTYKRVITAQEREKVVSACVSKHSG